jgi:hypothetical protein
MRDDLKARIDRYLSRADSPQPIRLGVIFVLYGALLIGSLLLNPKPDMWKPHHNIWTGILVVAGGIELVSQQRRRRDLRDFLKSMPPSAVSVR